MDIKMQITMLTPSKILFKPLRAQRKVESINRGGGRLTRGVGDRDRDLAAGCLVNSYFLSLSPCPSSSPFLAFSLSLYLPVSPCMPVPAAAP